MDKIKELFGFVMSRAKERSTWLGLVAVGTALGLTFTPEQSEAVVALGLAVGGAVAAFSKDKK